MSEKKSLTKLEATEFFAEFYKGQHHIPGFEPKEHGEGWCVNHDRGELSTFDFNQLTRLVIMAHDQCIRAEVHPIRNGIMRIAIWKRHTREGSMYERHPTIEKAISDYREFAANNKQRVTI